MLEVRLHIKVLIPLIYLFTLTTSDKSPYTFYPSPSTPDREIDSKFILIDEKYNRTYFSAINTLYSSTLDLQNVKEYDLSPNDKVMADCLGKEKCRNFIKILKFDTRGNIFVCGTYAMSPKCLTFNRTEEGLNMIKMSTGNNRSPDVPDQNATIVYSDPFYFVATKGKNFKAIRKFYLNKDSVEAETVNKQTVFSNPHFVSSYTFGTNYTYFFFYEYSIENTERRLMYSRIGRVCKHDSGDGDNQYFYTFLKAQLKCYKKGESVDVYYDELRATEFVNVHDASSNDIEQYVYALFSTPDGLGGSALCRYRVRDIENLFDTSDLYEQKDDNWIKVPMSTERTKLSRPKCDKKVVADFAPENLDEIEPARQQPLLYQDIEPSDGEALWTHASKSLTSFAITDVHMYEDSSDIGMHIIFLGSQHGEILKLSINSAGKAEPVVIETLKPFKDGQPIAEITIHKDEVYAASRKGIAMMNVQRCSNQMVCANCLALRDPYCAWSKSQKKCGLAKSIKLADRLMDIYHGKSDDCPKEKTYFSCNIETVQHLPGSKTILKCSASSNESATQPTIIAWNFQKQPLAEDVENGVSFVPQTPTTQQTLEVSVVTESNAGLYECIIELEDERKHCSATIDVPVKTTTTTTTMKTMNTADGSTRNNTTVHPTAKTPSSFIQSSSTSHRVSTERKTTPATPATATVGKTTKDDDPSYLEAFIAMLIVCIILFIILIIVCVCRYKNKRVHENSTETDGKQNGHANGQVGFKMPFSKKYKMNRRDSANKELIKKKNKNQVYKDTTLEMTETEEKTPVPV